MTPDLHLRRNWTGTSSSTTIYGAQPCPGCGDDARHTTEFHGYWLTLCVACGREL